MHEAKSVNNLSKKSETTFFKQWAIDWKSEVKVEWFISRGILEIVKEGSTLGLIHS